MSAIKERLAHVMDRIEEARKRSPWHQEVTLVAVTKFHPLEDMEEAIRLGVTQVGENRVQEMEQKYKALTLPVTWNLQGHLQKNKVKKAVAMADLIQSGDSLEILEEINRRAGDVYLIENINLNLYIHDIFYLYLNNTITINQLEQIINEYNLTSKDLQILLCYALFPQMCLVHFHEDSLTKKRRRLIKYNKKLYSLILLLQKYIQIPPLKWIK